MAVLEKEKKYEEELEGRAAGTMSETTKKTLDNFISAALKKKDVCNFSVNKNFYLNKIGIQSEINKQNIPQIYINTIPHSSYETDFVENHTYENTDFVESSSYGLPDNSSHDIDLTLSNINLVHPIPIKGPSNSTPDSTLIIPPVVPSSPIFTSTLEIHPNSPTQLAPFPMSPTSSAEVKLFSYACPFDNCGKVFQKKHNLKSHTIIHTQPKSFQCDLCGVKFLRKFDRKRHLQN
ncbi:hypothetical protein HK099_001649, partial [Clydaea vesicula]